MKIHKIGQNYQGFYSGDVPEQALGYIGTSAVDSSQINAVFGKTSEAINLVNRFDGSLLLNVSFIFNFSKGGAYGVYLSELDRAIKTKALKKQLEQKGYDIKETDKGLTAFSKPGQEKSSEEIQKDIDQLYTQIQSKGGTAIGVNVASVLNAAKMDAAEIKSSDPNMWQWIALLHLGGTIVHEAVHAKGHMDEGPSEAAEQSFIQWALPQINDQYRQSMESAGKGEEFSPLIITDRKRHAKTKNWYRMAQQLSYYVPHHFLQTPTGSDLSGRFPNNGQLDGGIGVAEWSMMAQEGEDIPIESRLGRQYMSPLPPDLSQEHDSLEEQLRKFTREYKKLDPKASMDELLSEGYDPNRDYVTLEGLLDEKRPKPLIVPLKKNAANKVVKVATLFGWMNNLTISDGSTIPGLGDRVMAWEDRDESFVEEESWIKKQPRYNPEYDIKGFYYRWIDPRLRPQPFEDMTRDISTTHPAKRFAASAQLGGDVSQIFSILNVAKSKIKNNEILATRFIVTENVIPIIDKACQDREINIRIFHFGETDTKESIYSVWMSNLEIKDEKIEKIERSLQEKRISPQDIEEIDGLLGVSKQKEKAIQEVFSTVKMICKEYGFKDIYIVGSYPRDLITKTPHFLIENLDFAGGWADQNIKLGSLAAEKLGINRINISNKTMSLTFMYKDIRLNFNGSYAPVETKIAIKNNDIEETPLALDIFNRDFTINMLAYELATDKIVDLSKLALKDIKNKIIKTFLDPQYVCSKNPIVILRALKLKIRYGYDIDRDLKVAMMRNADLLFDGRYLETDLILARENVKKEGEGEAEQLFNEFRLDLLEKIK